MTLLSGCDNKQTAVISCQDIFCLLASIAYTISHYGDSKNELISVLSGIYRVAQNESIAV